MNTTRTSTMWKEKEKCCRQYNLQFILVLFCCSHRFDLICWSLYGWFTIFCHTQIHFTLSLFISMKFVCCSMHTILVFSSPLTRSMRLICSLLFSLTYFSLYQNVHTFLWLYSFDSVASYALLRSIILLTSIHSRARTHTHSIWNEKRANEAKNRGHERDAKTSTEQHNHLSARIICSCAVYSFYFSFHCLFLFLSLSCIDRIIHFDGFLNALLHASKSICICIFL